MSGPLGRAVSRRGASFEEDGVCVSDRVARAALSRNSGKIFVDAGTPSLLGRRLEEGGHLGIKLASLARIDGEAGEDEDRNW